MSTSRHIRLLALVAVVSFLTVACGAHKQVTVPVADVRDNPDELVGSGERIAAVVLVTGSTITFDEDGGWLWPRKQVIGGTNESGSDVLIEYSRVESVVIRKEDASNALAIFGVSMVAVAVVLLAVGLSQMDFN